MRLIPVPFCIRRRAWECARDIRERGNDDVPVEARIHAEVVLAAGPERIGWDDAGAMFRAHRALWGVRV